MRPKRPDTYTDSHSNDYPDGNSYIDRNAYLNTNSHINADSDGYSQRDTDSNSYANWNTD